MNYAIVVGIDHYKKRPLNGAVADANAFAGWLTASNQVTVLDSPPDGKQTYLKLLTSDVGNEIAMGQEIDIALNDIINDAFNHLNEKNRLYFFFSGHGIGVTFTNTALCLRLWPELGNFCMSGLKYLDGLVNQGVFDEILTFLDCCREYDALKDPRPPGFDYQVPLGTKQPGVITFYSTPYGKLSFEIDEDPNKKRGAFTSFIIEALKGDAADPAGVVTGGSLKKHIDDNFQSYALKYNKIQSATVDERGGDNIVICKVAPAAAAYNYVITFNRTADVTLTGPDLSIIYTAWVSPGEQWQKTLKIGFHQLKDNGTGEIKFFSNYNVNTVNNESF